MVLKGQNSDSENYSYKKYTKRQKDKVIHIVEIKNELSAHLQYDEYYADIEG